MFYETRGTVFFQLNTPEKKIHFKSMTGDYVRKFEACLK